MSPFTSPHPLRLTPHVSYAMPPFTPMTCPVIYPACSDSRNETSAATSSGVPARFIGTIASTCSGLNAFLVEGDSIRPGATTLTVMPRDANSIASDLLAPCRPALAAA